MRERGYGPGELAYQSGVSYNYIYKIRKGGAPNIAAAQVEKLAKALKTTPAYLRGLTNNSSADEISYEVIEGRAELRPETEELAARLDELPDTLRARLVGAVSEILALVDEQLGRRSLSELKLQLLDYLDDMPEEDQEELVAEVRRAAERAEARRRAAAGGQTDARRTSGG